MKSFALAVVAFLLITSQVLRAQQQQPVSAPPAGGAAASAAAAAKSAAAPGALPPPTMSPYEIAVMHGDILMARKEFEEAIKAYDHVLSTAPKDSVVLNKVGVAYQQLGALNHAEHYYKRSMKADKTYMSSVNNLGTVEYEKKHYGKAIHYYVKAVSLRGDTATVYSNLGYAYFGDKQYAEAMTSFERALQLDPDVFTRRSGFGSVIQQRTATDPGLFYFFVAKAYAASGDAEQTAHFLKLARDDGYLNFMSAETDPGFAKVIKDPRVREVLVVQPAYARDGKAPAQN
jgi:tetratricopeptide (TPR) repeat protein